MRPWRSVVYVWLVVLAYCLFLAAAMILTGATFRGLTLREIETANLGLFRQLGWGYFCLYFSGPALIAVLRWRQKKNQLNKPKIQSIDPD
jgi:hypothetical protein